MNISATNSTVIAGRVVFKSLHENLIAETKNSINPDDAIVLKSIAHAIYCDGRTALTTEEKQMLKKYGLTRSGGHIFVGKRPEYRCEYAEKNITHILRGYNSEKIDPIGYITKHFKRYYAREINRKARNKRVTFQQMQKLDIEEIARFKPYSQHLSRAIDYSDSVKDCDERIKQIEEEYEDAVRRLSRQREERLLLAEKDRQKYASRMLSLMHTTDAVLEELRTKKEN